MALSKMRWLRLSAFTFALGAFFLAIYFSFKSLDYEWDFKGLASFFWDANSPGIILFGLWGTIWISTVSIIIGSCFGMLIGLLLSSSEALFRGVAYAFVELFRNTPVLVQLYILYFVVGTSFNWSAETSAIVCLSLFCSSYVGEILRAAITQFDHGQRDASVSLGMSSSQYARFVAGPQILRRILPSLIGQFVSLVKDSSLVSVISILELTKSATNIVAATFRSFETWIVIAGIYFILNFSVSRLGRVVENKLSKDLTRA